MHGVLELIYVVAWQMRTTIENKNNLSKTFSVSSSNEKNRSARGHQKKKNKLLVFMHAYMHPYPYYMYTMSRITDLSVTNSLIGYNI